MEADLNPQYEQAPMPITPEPKRKKTKLVVTIIAVLVIATLAGVGAYLWRDQEALSQLKERDSKISSLEKALASVKAELAELKKTKPAGAENDSQITKEMVMDNVKDAISSKNYAGAQDYMAGTVRVILAASEGIGDRTPAQVVSDLAYLNSATAPWNFSLPAAELADYRSGDYASYFPAGALVGKSANSYVISVTFNADDKITGIFISPSADLL